MHSWQQLAERSLSVAQVRDVDRIAIERYGMHSLVLMENAALNCAHWFCERFRIPPRVCILCGRGNNGGDGLVLARQLRAAGWACDVVVLGPVESMSEDTRANWHVLSDCGQATADSWLVEVNDATSSAETAAVLELVTLRVEHADVVIDALLGTGARGEPREPFRSWITVANAASAMRVALDIPTGLDADTGQPASVVFRADETLTFVARKQGFGEPAAQACLGELTVLPIGIPRELIVELLDQSAPSEGGGS